MGPGHGASGRALVGNSKVKCLRESLHGLVRYPGGGERKVRTHAPERAIDVLMSPGPDELADNPCLQLLFTEVAKHGVRVSPFSGKVSLLRRYDVIHVHFPEWLVRWRNSWMAPFDIVSILGLLWLARRRGSALIWTGHDLEPHELSHPWLWRFYSKFFISQVDLLISFSKGATALLVDRYPQLASVPTVVVPHGHYRDYYTAPPDATAFREDLRLDDRPILLCFGLIRPYKNIPGIIRAWKQLPGPRPQLVIAGRPMDPELAEIIRSEAGDSSDIHLLLRFVPPDEVPTIFAAADVVLMPYLARSTLNSGVAHLALSLDRPAVLHDGPANRDLRDTFGAEWVWLCDGTAEDTLRVALAAVAAPRPEVPDLQSLEYEQLAAATLRAYLAAIATPVSATPSPTWGLDGNALPEGVSPSEGTVLPRSAAGPKAPQDGLPAGLAKDGEQRPPMTRIPGPEHLVQDDHQPVKSWPAAVLLHVANSVHSLQRLQSGRAPRAATAMTHPRRWLVVHPESRRVGSREIVGLLRVQEEPLIPAPHGAVAGIRDQQGGARRPLDAMPVAVGLLLPHHLAQPAGPLAGPPAEQSIPDRAEQCGLPAERGEPVSVSVEKQRDRDANGRVVQRGEHLTQRTCLELSVRVEHKQRGVLAAV